MGGLFSAWFADSGESRASRRWRGEDGQSGSTARYKLEVGNRQRLAVTTSMHWPFGYHFRRTVRESWSAPSPPLWRRRPCPRCAVAMVFFWNAMFASLFDIQKIHKDPTLSNIQRMFAVRLCCRWNRKLCHWTMTILIPERGVVWSGLSLGFAANMRRAVYNKP